MAIDLATVFDSDRTRRPPYRRLLAEISALLGPAPQPALASSLPSGGSRPVLVLPPFLAGDWLTRDLRRFLDACGFSTSGWGPGVNWGPTDRILARLHHRFDALRQAHGPVALVGISLGGLLARNLAYDRPDDVSHVVTIGSPFRLPTASTIEPIVRLCAHRYSVAIDPARLQAPLPVPSTMIWSRDDGIVAGDSCWTEEPDGCVIEVGGPHIALASNPLARRAMVQHLADPRTWP